MTDIKENKSSKKFNAVFNSEDSLHMRTAGKISIVSHKYPNLEIVLKKGDRKATADSVLSLVMLDVERGDDIEIHISHETLSDDDSSSDIENALKEIMGIVS